MELAVEMRTKIITIYKRYETPINYALKFIMGFIVFASINGFFSSLDVPVAGKISRFSVVLLAAALTAIAPITWAFVLMWLFIIFHLFYFSLELSVIAGMLFLCMILFYVRIFPKESYLIILLVLCFKLKIPYFVPLFAGLFLGISSVGALIIGVLTWYAASCITMFINAGSTLDGINILSLPQTFAENYELVMEMLLKDEVWIHIALTFVLTATIVLVISKLPVDYSMEIAIAAGTLVLLISMMIGVFAGSVEFNVFGILFSVIVSAMLAYICKFFYVMVDYSGTERVSFQDNEYVYYVKAVPKIRSGIDGDA